MSNNNGDDPELREIFKKLKKGESIPTGKIDKQKKKFEGRIRRKNLIIDLISMGPIIWILLCILASLVFCTISDVISSLF